MARKYQHTMKLLSQIKARASLHKTYEGYIKNYIKPNIGSMEVGAS